MTERARSKFKGEMIIDVRFYIFKLNFEWNR